MRIELVLIFVTAFIVFNIYTDGRFLKKAIQQKKYFQMVGVVFGALFVYYLIKRNPMKAQEIIATSNEYVKYLPVDRNIISPILDFTANAYNHPPSAPYRNHLSGYGGGGMGGNTRAETRILNSGKTRNTTTTTTTTSTKRSVSETKKKFVAASQGWKCGHCKEQLPAWFEVDHIQRLEHGGSNHVDNLVALCRNCHGAKTAVENL